MAAITIREAADTTLHTTRESGIDDLLCYLTARCRTSRPA